MGFVPFGVFCIITRVSDLFYLNVILVVLPGFSDENHDADTGADTARAETRKNDTRISERRWWERKEIESSVPHDGLPFCMFAAGVPEPQTDDAMDDVCI